MEHRLLRRAMWVDLTRLASLTPAVADGPRRDAMQRYVVDLSRVFDSQDHFVRDVLWPALSASGGVRAELPYADDLVRAARAMQAAASAAVDGCEFADRLAGAVPLLAAVLSAEQRHVVPVLEARLPPEVRLRLQVTFRRELPAGVVAFVIPMAMPHADPEQARRLVAEDDPAVSLALKIFGPRFATREALVFGACRDPRLG